MLQIIVVTDDDTISKHQPASHVIHEWENVSVIETTFVMVLISNIFTAPPFIIGGGGGCCEL
jgi:hypothetical protein